MNEDVLMILQGYAGLPVGFGPPLPGIKDNH